MERILIKELERGDDGWIFEVAVGQEDNATIHEVTVPNAYWKSLTDEAIPPGELVQKSFEFLLAREPKESILRKFELPVIQKYFSEYESRIRIRISNML